jgi:hypothetical protein
MRATNSVASAAFPAAASGSGTTPKGVARIGTTSGGVSIMREILANPLLSRYLVDDIKSR